MERRKRIRHGGLSLLLALLVMLSMTACGGSSSGGSYAADSAKYEESPAAAPAPSSMAGNGYWADEQAEMEYGGSADQQAKPDSGNELPEGVKMIYRATMELESTDFDKAAADVRTLTAQLGGYFENQSMWNRSGGYRSAEFTVRVPAAKFQTFLTQIGDLCTVRYQTQSAENVSEYYYDMEARLATQRIKLERLQELLSKAEEMEDIITLESAISDTEYQIENLSGELRHYDALIGYSTINVTLSEVYRVTGQQTAPLTFGERLSRAFRDGLEDFGDAAEDFAEWLAYSWLSLLFWIAVIVAAFKLIRRFRRKSGKDGRGGLFGRKKKAAEKSTETSAASAGDASGTDNSTQA